MIPDIGLMVGAYIVVRMISFMTRRNELKESILVRILSIIVILITLICVADLLMAGSSIPNNFMME